MKLLRSILHVDMDAFYASVEQLDDPALSNRPVIVGAAPKEGKGRGVVAACSYEARKFGIRSALPISTAWKLCPQGSYVRPRMQRYAEVSAQIMQIFSDFTDLVEPLSIDEAFLDVTGSTALHGSALEIAKTIKAAIRNSTRLTASVGVAPNKFLAKIASDLRKPDGLVVVAPEGVADFLRELPISKLWGVGPKTELRIRPLGVRTIGQMAALSRETLMTRLGNLGDHLHQLSHGLDDRPVVPHADPRSISNETTFETDTRDESLLLRTIHELADEVGRRLRRHKFRARKITIKLRYEDFSTHTRQTSLENATQSNTEISRIAVSLFRQFPLDRKIRLLGVGSGELVGEQDEPAQLGLFAAGSVRTDKLGGTLDEIHQRFGRDSLRRGSQLLGDED